MAGFLAEDPVFGFSRELSKGFLESRLLPGLDGAYREVLVREGRDVKKDIYVGLAVQQAVSGELEGCRVVKVGIVEPADLNTIEFWPEAPVGVVKIAPFDVSEFPSSNGMMVSKYVLMNFKIKVPDENGVYKTVKEGERAARGYSGLIMRVFFVPKSIAGGDYMVTVMPVNEVGDIVVQYEAPEYPGIKVHGGKFKFSSPEGPEHQFGIGNLPYFNVSEVDWVGGVPQGVQDITWAASMVVKSAVADTLAAAVTPNWHKKATGWRDAVDKNKFSKQPPASVWPSPVMEGVPQGRAAAGGRRGEVAGDESENEGELGQGVLA
jgi:hypothetical protein